MPRPGRQSLRANRVFRNLPPPCREAQLRVSVFRPAFGTYVTEKLWVYGRALDVIAVVREEPATR